MALRFIMEVAWQAHFVKNMFIIPTDEELKDFEPDFIIYNASKAKMEDYKAHGLNSETVIAFNITSKEQVLLRDLLVAIVDSKLLRVFNSFHAFLCKLLNIHPCHPISVFILPV